jgi:hypothetical protein
MNIPKIFKHISKILESHKHLFGAYWIEHRIVDDSFGDCIMVNLRSKIINNDYKQYRICISMLPLYYARDWKHIINSEIDTAIYKFKRGLDVK